MLGMGKRPEVVGDTTGLAWSFHSVLSSWLAWPWNIPTALRPVTHGHMALLSRSLNSVDPQQEDAGGGVKKGQSDYAPLG